MWSVSKCAYLAFPFLVCLLAGSVQSAAVMKPGSESIQEIPHEHHHLKAHHRFRRTYVDDEMNCAPQEFEMVHTIMDRICSLCHELHSHFAPNTRVECRSNCFRNERFQSCMKIFSAKKAILPVEPTAPVPLYTEDMQTLDDIKERRRRI